VSFFIKSIENTEFLAQNATFCVPSQEPLVSRKIITMRLFQILVFTFLATSAIAQPQSYVGNWGGDIKLSQVGRLAVIFYIEASDNTMNCSMEVPQQSNQKHPAEEVSVQNNQLYISYPELRASFRGKLVGQKIEGTWFQNGMNFPLNLEPHDPNKLPDRPQHPIAPFDYDISEVNVSVSVNSGSINLAGTLTTPKGEGPFPLAVMVSGSGPQDRDETLFHHKPFWVIADYLTRNGIAVYRYDERGVGQSSGDFESATTQDFTNDALAVLDHVNNLPNIDKEKTGIIGHSEGALVASMAAAKSANVKFAILLAGPSVPGKQLLIRQIRDISLAEGMSPEDIQKESQIRTDIINIAAGPGSVETRRAAAKSKLKDFYDVNFSAAEKEEKGPFEQYFQAIAEPLMSDWMHYFLNTEPKEYIEQMACPTFAMIGSKDMQVSADDNISAFRAALNAAPTQEYKVKVIDNVNHLFQHSRTGRPSEYGILNETFAHEVLVMMRDWLIAIY